MKTSSNRRSVIVGIFILLGLIIFAITILTLGSQRKTFSSAITIKAFFANVNGLQKGNNIWFSGVKVGTIKDVQIAGQGRVQVIMSILDESKNFIHKDAFAKISTDGLIGNKIIEIYGGSASSPAIQEDDVLATEALLSTDDMMNTLSKNNDNLLAITSNFKILSGQLVEGKGTLGKLLSDETLINQVNATSRTLQQAAANLQQLSANVEQYTSRLNQKGTLANDLVSDTVIFNRLRNTIGQLQEVAHSSRDAIGNLKRAGDSLNAGLNNANAPLGMLLKDEASAAHIKATLENLQMASKKLDEDLEALQHNFLFRRFFKKKAKENMRVVLDTVVTK